MVCQIPQPVSGSLWSLSGVQLASRPCWDQTGMRWTLPESVTSGCCSELECRECIWGRLTGICFSFFRMGWRTFHESSSSQVSSSTLELRCLVLLSQHCYTLKTKLILNLFPLRGPLTQLSLDPFYLYLFTSLCISWQLDPQLIVKKAWFRLNLHSLGQVGSLEINLTTTLLKMGVVVWT